MSDRLLKRLVLVLAVLVVAWALARFVGGLGGPAAALFDLAAVAASELDSAIVAAPEIHHVATMRSACRRATVGR